MPSPLITVVIPVKDRATIVGRTLQSIEAQTLRPLRMIIVDNGSTDGTLKTVSDWAAAHSNADFTVDVISEPTPGASAARNAAMPLISSPYVAFFDSDDVMLPDHLSSVAAELERRPDADIAMFDVAMIDDDGWIEKKHCHDECLLRAHLLHGALSTQRFVAGRQILTKAGLWNNDCKRWNDLEYGTRILMQNPTVVRIHDRPRVYIYHTDESITGSSMLDADRSCEKTLTVIEQLLEGDSHETERQWIDARRAILAAHYAREGKHDDATRLMRSVLAKSSLKMALKLRAIYSSVRLTGHGGAFLARYLMPVQGTVTEK